MNTACVVKFILNLKILTRNIIQTLIKPREATSHKGTFGHALLVAGSYGMMGAAVLSALACMRSGVGKLTVHSIPAGLQIMQMLQPEAMYWEALGGKTNSFISTQFTTKAISGQYQAIGIGPGLGIHGKLRESIAQLCEICAKLNIPMVLDADDLIIFRQEKGEILSKRFRRIRFLHHIRKSFKN